MKNEFWSLSPEQQRNVIIIHRISPDMDKDLVCSITTDKSASARLLEEIRSDFSICKPVGNAVKFYYEGIKYFEKESYIGAIVEFEKFLIGCTEDELRNHYQVYMWLGYAYYYEEQKKAALYHLQKGLKTFPQLENECKGLIDVIEGRSRFPLQPFQAD